MSMQTIVSPRPAYHQAVELIGDARITGVWRHEWVDRRSRRRKSWWIRARGSLAIATILPFVVLALFSVSWMPRPWQLALDAAGTTLFFGGAVLRLWSTLYIGGRKGHEVVRTGPYSVCRNPLYLGTLLMSLSVPCFLGSLTLASGIVMASAIYLGAIIPAEERRLHDRFGKWFSEYCQRVPRIVPRPWLWSSPELLTIDTRCLGRELRRASAWIVLPVAARMLAELRLLEWWPHLTNWPC